MTARTPPIPPASTFFFGPPDRRRSRAGRRQAPHPSPHPERQPQPEQAQKASAVRETSYASSVKVGIPSKEPPSYRGHVAREMRATAEASRRGRPPREGARNMKGTTRTFLIVLAMATILATVTTGAALAGKCGHGNNPNCSGGSGGGGGTGSLTGPVMVYDANGNGLPNYGDSVTFNPRRLRRLRSQRPLGLGPDLHARDGRVD